MVKNDFSRWPILSVLKSLTNFICIIIVEVNMTRELITIRENYKSINFLTMCDVDFMIESMSINYIIYYSCKICFLYHNKEYYIYSSTI